MSWRGSNTFGDRILACLPYLLPLIEVLGYGTFLFQQFPALRFLIVPLTPFILIYSYIGRFVPYLDLVVFFALFFLVVRNETIGHFIRFNTMQAILLSIFLSICGIVLELLGITKILELGFSVPVSSSFSAPIFLVLLVNTIFLSIMVACTYSIVQALRGLYAEIPVISEAAYSQTR